LSIELIDIFVTDFFSDRFKILITVTVFENTSDLIVRVFLAILNIASGHLDTSHVRVLPELFAEVFAT